MVLPPISQHGRLFWTRALPSKSLMLLRAASWKEKMQFERIGGVLSFKVPPK